MKNSHRNDLWINPRSNLKGPDGNRAWNNGGNINAQNGARFLELADMALGLKKPSEKKKNGSVSTHDTDKKAEPYTG